MDIIPFSHLATLYGVNLNGARDTSREKEEDISWNSKLEPTGSLLCGK